MIKKYYKKILLSVATIAFLSALSVPSAMAVSSSCSYVHNQTCCGNGAKTLATGTVTINHDISIHGGNKTNFSVGDIIVFDYSWDGSFTATGGYWDTPTVFKCSTWNGCFSSFVGATKSNHYTQKIVDDNGRIGYVQWQADEHSNAGISASSSDNSVVACTGVICAVLGNGNATITVTASSVWVRLFSEIFSDVSPSGWYASLAPEGFIDVPGKGYIIGNSKLDDGCIIRNMKSPYTTLSNTGNYKGLRIPSKSEMFTVNTPSTPLPKTKPSTTITAPTKFAPTDPYDLISLEGQNIDFKGTNTVGSGGGSTDRYVWVDIDLNKTNSPSYLGTDCRAVDGVDTNGDGTVDINDLLRFDYIYPNFSTSSLSLGDHKICFSVRQKYADGTVAWANPIDNVDIKITSATPPPTVDLKINGSDNPISVSNGSDLNLTWTTSDATSCSVINGIGWNNPSPNIPNGNNKVTASTDSAYTLSCIGPGGTGNDSVSVQVTSSCTPNYTYSCISTNSVDCNKPSNCGLSNTPTNSCLASDTNGCVPPANKPLSDCETANGVGTCPATGTTVACPACANESNWVEVNP